jgi:hypothetical protein
MKIEKIEIQTPNKKYATDIAMLVDKEEFLLEIQRLRTEWEINNLLSPSAIYDGFLEKYLSTDNGKIDDEKEIHKRLSKFVEDINAVLKKFRRDRGFKRVVEYALATGIIPDRIYKRCYFDKVIIGEPEDISKPEKYQYVIVMSPRTEKGEVDEAYAEFQEFIRGHEPKHELDDGVLGKIDWQKSEGAEDAAEYEYFVKGPVYDAADITKFGTMSQQLDRTREWYWIAYRDKFNNLSTKRKRSEDILDEWQKENCPVKTEHGDIKDKLACAYCCIENVNDIDQALSTYSKLLIKS